MIIVLCTYTRVLCNSGNEHSWLLNADGSKCTQCLKKEEPSLSVTVTQTPMIIITYITITNQERTHIITLQSTYISKSSLPHLPREWGMCLADHIYSVQWLVEVISVTSKSTVHDIVFAHNLATLWWILTNFDLQQHKITWINYSAFNSCCAKMY